MQQIEAALYFDRTRLPDLAEEDIERWHAQLVRRAARRSGGTLSPATIVQAHRFAHDPSDAEHTTPVYTGSGCLGWHAGWH